MAVAVAVAVVALVGCQGGAATPATSTSASPSVSSPPATPSAPAATASASPSPTSSAPPSAASNATVVDPGLLRILPEQVDGVPIEPSPETAASLVVDPELRRSASALAVGMAIAPGASGSDDLAVATVVQLRPGVFDDAFFTGWRGAYDAAACAQAGGIAGHDRRTIGTHQVEITVCSGGAQTYHVHLDGDVIVSITAIGDRRFGELVVGGLRE